MPSFRSMAQRAGRRPSKSPSRGDRAHLDLLAHHTGTARTGEKREYLVARAPPHSFVREHTGHDYFERPSALLRKQPSPVLLNSAKFLSRRHWHRAGEVDGEALALAESLDDGLRRASARLPSQNSYARKDATVKRSSCSPRGAWVRGVRRRGRCARVLHLTGTGLGSGRYDKRRELSEEPADP